MGGLFPGWSDTAFRVALVVLASSVAALVLAPWIYVRTPYGQGREAPVDQPVQFDHRHHVEDDEIECRYCHGGVETTATAGIPSTDVCMGCHNQVWNDARLLEPVRRSYFSGQPIPWNRVHDLPDFVYFHHAVHVKRGIACARCHGRVEQMPLVLQVAPLTMAWCLDCHRDPAWRAAGVPGADGHAVTRLTTCSACHR